MKKILLIFISVVLLGLVGLFSSPYLLKTSEQRHFEKSLSKALSEGKKEIPLKELTNFEWDSLCVSAPYGEIPEKQYSNYKIKGFIPSKSSADESWFMIFRDEKNKIAYVIRSPISKIAFGKVSGLHEPSCYTNNNINLTLQPESNYYRFSLNTK